MSCYWYHKRDIPSHETDKIRDMVKGEPVDVIHLNGEAKKILSVDGRVFKEVFEENRKYLYRGNYTAPSDENNYDDSDNYLSEDGLAGFSVTHSGWLTSLFSNYRQGSGFISAIKDHVISNAYKLVCIVTGRENDNRLIEIYKEVFDFRVYAKTIDDSDAMRSLYGDRFMDRFIKECGVPFHVFMIGKNAFPCNMEIKEFDDYYEAEAFVNTTVKRDNGFV